MPTKQKICEGCDITNQDPDLCTNGTVWRESDEEKEPQEWGYYDPPWPRDEDGMIVVDVSTSPSIPVCAGAFCKVCADAKSRDFKGWKNWEIKDKLASCEKFRASWESSRKAVGWVLLGVFVGNHMI